MHNLHVVLSEAPGNDDIPIYYAILVVHCVISISHSSSATAAISQQLIPAARRAEYP